MVDINDLKLKYQKIYLSVYNVKYKRMNVKLVNNLCFITNSVSSAQYTISNIFLNYIFTLFNLFFNMKQFVRCVFSILLYYLFKIKMILGCPESSCRF